MKPEISYFMSTISTIDLIYDSAGRVTKEKVTKTGPTVTYDKQYTYDKVSRRLTVKDVTNGNWLETSRFDAAGRLSSITVTAGTGSNPFSWPKGTTNVTCDANGNITQLWGRNVDDGTIWKVAHQFDYEQRVTKVLLDNGDTVQTIYDGQGYKIKELVTSGGSTTEKRFVQAYNYVIQERDGTDTVTARYYWDSTRPFKKDHGSSAKYFVPELRNSPFTAWNNAGTFNRYDLWDSFGVEEDQSAAGSLSPFERHSYQREASTHLTRAPQNLDYYPELGKRVRGKFGLKFAASPGTCALCETKCCALAPIMDPDQEIPSDCWLGCGDFCEIHVPGVSCPDCCCLRVQQQRFCPGAGGHGGPPIDYDWVAVCGLMDLAGACDPCGPHGGGGGGIGLTGPGVTEKKKPCDKPDFDCCESDPKYKKVLRLAREAIDSVCKDSSGGCIGKIAKCAPCTANCLKNFCNEKCKIRFSCHPKSEKDCGGTYFFADKATCTITICPSAVDLANSIPTECFYDKILHEMLHLCQGYVGKGANPHEEARASSCAAVCFPNCARPMYDPYIPITGEVVPCRDACDPDESDPSKWLLPRGSERCQEPTKHGCSGCKSCA